MPLDKFEFVKIMIIGIFLIICVIKKPECQVEIDGLIVIRHNPSGSAVVAHRTKHFQESQKASLV
jgi:energy-converting hydrogenase Eha subunit H